MRLGFKEVDLVEIALTSVYLVLGTIFIAVDFPLRNELLLPISATLLGILVYDLDVPKRIIGIGRNTTFRIYGSIFGAMIPFFIKANLIGLIVIILCFVLGPVLFTIPNWKEIDWSEEDRVQQVFKKALQQELRTNPGFAKTDLIILRCKRVSAVDFLKILVLMGLTLQGLALVFIVSFLTSMIGNSFVMEASLFLLLAIWIIINSSRILLKRRWKRLWDKMERKEEDIWRFTLQQFSTLKGALYLIFFIPSSLFAIVGTYLAITVYPLIIAAPLLLPVSNIELILHWIASITLLWVWFIAAIYPFYVTVKLYQAIVTKKRVRLLKFPLLCIILSLVFSLLIQFSSYVPDINFFNLVTLEVLALITVTLILFAVWVGVIWMWMHGRYTKMNLRLERNLVVVMTVFSLPFYRFFDVVLLPLLFLGILGIVLMIRIVSFPREIDEIESRTLVTIVLYLILVSFYVFFLFPEFSWLIVLTGLGIFMLLLGLLPEKYRDKMPKILVREVEPNEVNSN